MAQPLTRKKKKSVENYFLSFNNYDYWKNKARPDHLLCKQPERKLKAPLVKRQGPACGDLLFTGLLLEL